MFSIQLLSDLLTPAGPAYTAAAPAALHDDNDNNNDDDDDDDHLHDVDVAPLAGPRHELDAGLLVVVLEGLGDDAPLTAVELACIMIIMIKMKMVVTMMIMIMRLNLPEMTYGMTPPGHLRLLSLMARVNY